MSRIRVDDIPIEPVEPFGMTGVLVYLRPLLAVLSACCAAGCIYMASRSATMADGLQRQSASSTVWIDSLFGQLRIDVGPAIDPNRESTYYQPYSGMLRSTMTDDWGPSLLSALGIEWGKDVHTGRRATFAVFRFRMRWRTLALLYAVPPTVAIVAAFRRRASIRRDAEALAVSGSAAA